MSLTLDHFQFFISMHFYFELLLNSYTCKPVHMLSHIVILPTEYYNKYYNKYFYYVTTIILPMHKAC